MTNDFRGFHKKADFQNQHITQINRLPAHGLRPENDPQKEYQISLDGIWSFFLAPSPDDLPESYASFSLDEKEWQDIKVPGNWELQGHGTPVYVNTLYPFKDTSTESYLLDPGSNAKELKDTIFHRYNPPYVPKENVCGLYRKKIDFPSQFDNRNTIIRFDGVESAFYLYVNELPVGYSQDSKLPSEFDISSYLKDGENLITLVVLRFCDGTWLEDQDYWHLSGIHRSVTLWSRPEQRIQDIKLTGSPLGRDEGILEGEISVNRVSGFLDNTIKLEIFHENGTLLQSSVKQPAKDSPIFGMGTAWHMKSAHPRSETANFSMKLDQIIPWDVDHPQLYTVVISLMSSAGDILDQQIQKLGFRKICIEDNVIKLNGKRVVFRGVNRHEHSCKTGRVVTRSEMIAEIRLMKQLNFNAVRTSHYPNSALWYDLCDEYGLMVVCESNLETHGLAARITTDPEWSAAMLERARRMALFHKNHSSIISWSLGNESGYGAGHAAMAGWLREYDPSRLVHYKHNDPGPLGSDIKCSMYPSMEILMQMIADNRDRRPIVLVEYAYQISNTTGHFELFQKLTETYEIFQGGFVWDWMDKCLPAVTEDGVEYPGFGGDFGEDLTDSVCPYYMCANGVVLPDLKPKPSGLEIKEGQSPFIVELTDARSGSFILRNRTQSLDSSAIEVQWKLEHWGKCLESGALSPESLDQWDSEESLKLLNGADFRDLPRSFIEPESGDSFFHIDPKLWDKASSELYLTITVRLIESLSWVEKGFIFTDKQFCIMGSSPLALNPNFINSPSRLKVFHKSENLMIQGENFSIAFDNQGQLCQYRLKEVDYLSGKVEENLFRARSGLHLEDKWWGPVNELWSAFDPALWARHSEPLEWSVMDENRKVFIVSRAALKGPKGVVASEFHWTVDSRGILDLDFRLDADSSYEHLPRLGCSFVVSQGFDQLEWYGRGPGESYCDRKLSSKVGHYKSTVEETHFPFIPVSHNGSHADTRWVRLKNENGRSLLLEGRDFSFTVHHNSSREYQEVLHEHELIRNKEVYLDIDIAQAGIGGDLSWSSQLDNRHTVPAGSYSMKLRILGE